MEKTRQPDYYTPETPKPQTATVGTFHPIRMEQDSIIRRVSRDLYASPASGLRELVANEIRAAVLAKKAGADPHIEVTIRPERVQVWGRDSLGMERQIFDEIYMTLGRSGNFDGATPGQFGLGRAAYVTISDHMLLETRHRNGDTYAVLCVEGRGYQTGLRQPESGMGYGTRITLTPRDNAGTARMIDMVRDIASRSPIPITLVTADGTETPERRPLGGPDHILHADLPDAEFAFTARDPHDYYKDNRSPVERSYLCGMPIGFTYRGIYPVAGIEVDIHDERKHPPTPDRERMTEEAELAISHIIDAEVGRRLAAIPRSLPEAIDHPDCRLAVALAGDDPVLGRLSDEVPVYAGTGGDGRPESADQLLGELQGSPILNCRAFLSNRIAAVLERYPKAAFVRKAPGLPDIAGFMRERGLRPLGARGGQSITAPADRRFTIHTHDDIRKIRADEQIDVRLYRVAGGKELREIRPRLRKGFALTVYYAPQAADFADLEAGVRGHRFDTSRGTMTGAEVLDAKAAAYPTERRSLLECWGDGPDGDGSILVHDDGSGSYEALTIMAERVSWWLSVRDMGSNEVALETYLRLDNPLLKRLMRDSWSARLPEFCDEFLRLDGKAPVEHKTDCECGACRAA